MGVPAANTLMSSMSSGGSGYKSSAGAIRSRKSPKTNELTTALTAHSGGKSKRSPALSHTSVKQTLDDGTGKGKYIDVYA